MSAEDLEDLIILGAGGGTRELISLIRQAQSLTEHSVNWEIKGILDDNEALIGQEVMRVPVLGTLADGKEYPDSRFITCIANSGTPHLRLSIAARMDLSMQRWASFVHPQALVLGSATVGSGTIIYPGVVVSSDARIGAQALVYYGAIVHHDSTVGDGSILCAGVRVAGQVTIGQSCYLGIGSTVRDHVKIGDGALIGMGAVVIKDVDPGQVVVGVPAEPLERSNYSRNVQ